MSGEMESRVGNLERSQARFDERLGGVERALGRTADGVDKLLEQNARRGEPQSIKTIVMTLASAAAIIGSVGGAAWWFVSVSPVVRQIEKRISKLDDPDVGRVPRVERRIETIEGWLPSVRTAKRD